MTPALHTRSRGDRPVSGEIVMALGFDGAVDDRRGIRVFVVGTGGATLRPFADVRRNSSVRSAHTYGVLKLPLDPRGYGWRFSSPRREGLLPTRALRAAAEGDLRYPSPRRWGFPRYTEALDGPGCYGFRA